MTMESKPLLPPERNNSEPFHHYSFSLAIDAHAFHSKSKELISDSDEEME